MNIEYSKDDIELLNKMFKKHKIRPESIYIGRMVRSWETTKNILTLYYLFSTKKFITQFDFKKLTRISNCYGFFSELVMRGIIKEHKGKRFNEYTDLKIAAIINEFREAIKIKNIPLPYINWLYKLNDNEKRLLGIYDATNRF